MAQSIEKRQLAARHLPPEHPKQMEAATLLAEFEIEKFRIAGMVLEGLRQLIASESYDLLDRELRRMSTATPTAWPNERSFDFRAGREF
jgi:hypothetical protein